MAGRPDFPSFHPFQKLVNARYCGAMVERITSACRTGRSCRPRRTTTRSATSRIDEQVATYLALIERKRFLGALVDRVLL
jgi:hypothetical protein